MAAEPNQIVDTVLAKFHELPKRFKPRSDGTREWVPLAGIVLRSDKPVTTPGNHAQPASICTCVALATGMKCHPHNRLPHLQGCGLHDSHAEILALRAFNRFLIDECADLAAGALGNGSEWLKWRESTALEQSGSEEEAVEQQQPFELREDVSIHMYISEAPCGDASMELTMAKQEDATPWSASNPSKPDITRPYSILDQSQQTANTPMHGRGHFDLLGKVRRKPSRPDAHPTLSKSCSDKLALKQCTGLLSALIYQLVWPGNIYLKSLILPESEYVPEACERAFGTKGRMAPVIQSDVQESWKRHGFEFKPFQIKTTRREFEYSKRYIRNRDSGTGLDPVPSNRSCMLTPRHAEVLINGVLEGRKWYDASGASVLSRKRMWKSTLGVAVSLGLPALSYLSAKCSYGELKAHLDSRGRGKVKADARRVALQGWVRNNGDDEWRWSDDGRGQVQQADNSNAGRENCK